MEFSRPVEAVIRSRVSWRSYTDRPVAGRARALLGEGLAAARGPRGAALRFRLVELGEGEAWDLRRAGTYGFIRGARTFVVGAVRRGPGDMEDYGFALERIILAATDLGLATCWLGGTFDRSGFGAAVGAAPDEVVPAVTPVGYATVQRSVADTVIRWGAGSTRRKPWEELFFDGDFAAALAPERAGQWATPLEMVRLAPSASNRQPWRIVRAAGGSALRFYVRRTAAYDRLTAVDLQRIDMGIAMCHFELAAREQGIGGGWTFEEDAPAATSPRTEYVATWTGL
jgi:nitroreductase